MFLKCIFDIVLSFFSLVMLLPVILLISFLVRIKLGSPVLFSQSRPGLNGKPFRMIKFRTMTSDIDSDGRLLPDSLRLVPFGAFLRSTSLDELPQLWSIITGYMSFVGPRPALFNQDDLIALRTKNGVDMLVPGLTGWAQVNGRDELPVSEKVALDLEYTERQSFWFDMKILWLTCLKVIKRDGVSH